MSDDRPAVYPEDGNLIIRASAIGHPCLWELIATGQGMFSLPFPALILRAFAEGNLLEPVILSKLENDYGLHFLSKQGEGELWLSDSTAIRYHPDGIATIGVDFWVNSRKAKMLKAPAFMGPSIPDHDVVVEAKALTNSSWQIGYKGSTGDTMSEYNWQLSAMMHDTGLPGLWAVYNKGLPPNKDGKREPHPDAGKMYLEYVTEPPIPLDEIQQKAALIKEGVEGEFLIETERPCDAPDHWPCLYLHVRPNTTDERKVLVPEGDMVDRVNDLARRYVTFKAQADEAKPLYEAARDELVAIAGDAAFIQTDKWYIPLVQGTSTRLDKSSMSPELKALLKEKYTKSSKTKKFVRGVKKLEM